MENVRIVILFFVALLSVVTATGCAVLDEPKPASPEVVPAQPAVAVREPEPSPPQASTDPVPGPAKVPEREVAPASAVVEPVPLEEESPQERRFILDSGASEFRVLVYAEGKLSRLGTHHVVEGRDLTGAIVLHGELPRSTFSLRFPVESMVVDEPEARVRAGDEFSTEIPPDKRTEVRDNMLGNRVLNALNFPEVRVEGQAAGGELPDLDLAVTIHLLDRSSRVNVPATVTIDGDRLEASGSFRLNQTDFGIEPFSMLAGAFTLKDEVLIDFHLSAEEER